MTVLQSITTDDGVRLDLALDGDPAGRPVVLLAGFKAAATSWRYQVPALVDAGYRVIAADLRGHGTTDPLLSGVTMDRRGQDLSAVLQELDLRNAVVVGGSMGGNTVWARVAQDGTDRIGAIAIVDQTPRMVNSADWPYGFYGYEESNLESYFATGIPKITHGTPVWRRGMRLVRVLKAMKGGDFTISSPELEILNNHAKRDWRPAIADCPVPVLFVAGEHSEFWPAGHAPAAAALAPFGKAVVIPNAGHATNVEQPKAFNRILLSWLATQA